VDAAALPNLLIVGVTKAGTTSLYWYLAQHPEICASTHKETNYFSPLRYRRQPTGTLDDYASYFAHCTGEPYRLEASPEYFYGGPELVRAVRTALPESRIIVSLRDPVDRLWSGYRYKRLQGGLADDVTFAQFFERCLELRRAGADVREEHALFRALSIGRYVDNLGYWFDAFGDDVYVMFFEHLATAPLVTMTELLTWLELDAEPARTFDYGVSQKTIEPRSKALHHRAKSLAARADRLFGLDRNRALKGRLRDIYMRLNTRAPVDEFVAADHTRVEEFYAEANAALARDLMARGYRDLPAWLSEPDRARTRLGDPG